MKTYLLTICWVLFWLVIGSTFLGDVPGKNLSIDVIFLTVLAIGFSKEWDEGSTHIAIIGLICDAISPAPFGIITITYFLAFTSIRMATSTIYVQSRVSQLVWTMVASGLAIWVKAIIMAFIFRNENFLQIAMWSFIPQSFLNAFLGIIFIPFFDWYHTLTWEKLFRPKGLVLK